MSEELNNGGPPEGSNLKKFTKDHWIAVFGIVTGLLIAFLVPIWNIYWVETPQLSVEINSISREISKDAGIPIQDYQELEVLGKGYIRSRSSSIVRILDEESGYIRRLATSKKGIYPPDEISEMLDAAKEELKSLPERIEKAKVDLEKVEKLTPESISLSDVSRLNRPISPEVKVDSRDFMTNRQNVQNNREYFDSIIVQFRNSYKSRVASIEERYSDLQTNLPSAERKIEVLIEDLKKKKAFFMVSAVLLNSGQSSISIKQPALLRIYIGTGNYVDLRIKLEKYQESAEVSAHGTRIASFKSNEISTIPEEDQKLINTYWGQSVHAILFTEDIMGNINASNPIAFSEGLYQKIIYDRLEGEASNIKYFTEQY